MRIHLLCIHKRISCGYTRDLLCIHNTLAGARDPKRARVQGLGAAQRPFWVPGPCKSVVHAQEISCVYTRDSFVYTQ